MAQYTAYTVSVTNGSAAVTGATGTKFLTNCVPGNAFKIKNDAVVYTVASVASDTQLMLVTPFLGVTNAAAQYQITRDYTPNYGLAEINVGDQDWPVHLTQDTIRKIDQILGEFVANGLIFKNNWNATTDSPAIPTAAPGNLGWMYKVSVAGSTNISGITTWEVGDTLISNGSSWVKIPGPLPSITAAVDTQIYTLANNLIQTQTMMVNHIAFA